MRPFNEPQPFRPGICVVISLICIMDTAPCVAPEILRVSYSCVWVSYALWARE